MSSLERPQAVFDDAEDFVDSASSLADRTPGRVLGVDGVDITDLLYRTNRSPASHLRTGHPVRMHQLDEGRGWTQSLVGTGPATLTITHGDGYVDFATAGANADDEVVIDMDVFGDGGAGENMLRDFGAALLIDPGSTDTHVADAFVSFEMYNPGLSRYMGVGLVWTGTQWDRSLVRDEGAGEVIAAVFNGSNENVSAAGFLNLHVVNRGSVNVTIFCSLNDTFLGGGDIQGESGLTSSPFINNTDDPAQFCRARMRIRPKTGSFTARIYYMECSNHPGAVTP